MTSACGLDIGSNTFSFVELRQGSSGPEVAEDASFAVRLSEGLTRGSPLKASAVARGLITIEELKQRFDLGEKPLRAVGTAVLRMAKNPEVFTQPARDILGVDIELISGEEEALLMGRGARLGLDEGGQWIAVDVGGQSTELCWRDDCGVWQPLSLPIGVVGLASSFLESDPPHPTEIEALRREVGSVISSVIGQDLQGQIAAVAGTATTLGVIDLELGKWQREKVHGLEMGRNRLQFWLGRMLAVSSKERTVKYGIRPRRADVFPAGLCVLDELLEHLGRDAFTISANGLRVGVALELMEGKR
ncbi:MAG: hypothetical protein GY847_40165 [Proteobacteria bacterium]|nr:hypothetical protein [Pseudomonadota bacterium]